MKKNQRTRWSAALGAGILATVAMMPQAKAELVYENGQPVQPARAEERTLLRQNLGAAERAQTTVQQPQTLGADQYPAQVQQVQIQQQPVIQAPILQQPVAQQQPLIQVGPARTEQPEVQNLSKSELLRRERVRAELKNEDLLQERLEELRLRDEERRTGEMFGATAATGPVAAPVAMQQQAVVAPITNHPGQVVASAPVQTDQMTVSSAASIAAAEEKTIMTIQPRFGLSQLNSESGYDIRPRFSGGLAVGLVSSDNLSFEVGYTYSEHGIALATTNNYYNYVGTNASPETVVMKQNIIDAGMKLHFLGPDAKLRPFIGGGAGYGRSYINYDQRILDAMARTPYSSNLGRDYQLDSFLGFLSTGLDLRVNKGITIGALFKYYTVLSSRERTPLNNSAIYGYYPSVNAADFEKQAIGGSLARTSFYSILGAATFTF